MPTTAATTLRKDSGPPLVIDGPFTETKELIAGFWLWKVDSLQEAIDWVKRCPNPHYEDSKIEIRPVFEAEDFGEALTPKLREQEARLRTGAEARRWSWCQGITMQGGYYERSTGTGGNAERRVHPDI